MKIGTQGEHRALARLHKAIAYCLAREFTFDGFDFDKPREAAKKARSLASAYDQRSHDRIAMRELSAALTGFADVTEQAGKEREAQAAREARR